MTSQRHNQVRGGGGGGCLATVAVEYKLTARYKFKDKLKRIDMAVL